MGRLVRLRRGRSPLHAVEEAIAALHEEMTYSLNFAHAMVRDENYRAAAEVIEEQRRSLIRTSEAIETALRTPEIARTRMRLQAALAGVAAAVMIGSAAFAGWGPATSPTRETRIEAIQRASAALSQATGISDPTTLQAIVGEAQDTILAIAGGNAAADPGVKSSLLDFVRKQAKVLQNPNIPAPIRQRAAEVIESVQKIVPEIPQTAPADSTSPAPAPEPSV
jgi:hypothetical protein